MPAADLDPDGALTGVPTAVPDETQDETQDEAQDAAPDGRDPTATTRGLVVILLVGGAIGLLAAMVLTIDRIRLLQDPTTQLACNISPFIACGPVLQSRAGALSGFPNPLLGIIGFTVLVTSGAALLAGATLHRWYFRGLQDGVLAAAAFITWLQTQSLYVIGALCLWCLLVWAVIIPIVVTVTLHNLAAGHLGSGLVRLGHRLSAFRPTVIAVVSDRPRRDRPALLPRVRPALVRCRPVAARPRTVASPE